MRLKNIYPDEKGYYYEKEMSFWTDVIGLIIGDGYSDKMLESCINIYRNLRKNLNKKEIDTSDFDQEIQNITKHLDSLPIYCPN